MFSNSSVVTASCTPVRNIVLPIFRYSKSPFTGLVRMIRATCTRVNIYVVGTSTSRIK